MINWLFINKRFRSTSGLIGLVFSVLVISCCFNSKISGSNRIKLRGPNRLQRAIENNLLSFLPSPEAELFFGIVIGSKKNFPESLFNSLKQTGTLHIAVASGMNLVLLTDPVFQILIRFLKRKTALLLLITLIWFYVLISGCQIPIIRAALSLSLVYLAQEFGKVADNFRILVMTGFVMVMFKPTIINDLSFQLSFAATAGLVLLKPVMLKIKFGPFRLNNFSSTLACQMATFPIILANFGEYNLLSLPVNLFVLWTIPIILQFGILAVTISFVCYPLARLLTYLIFPLLKYLVMVVEAFSETKIFWFWVPKFSLFWTGSYYLFLAFLVRKNIAKKDEA